MASRRLDIGSLISHDDDPDDEPPFKKQRPAPSPPPLQPESPSPKYTSTWPSALTTLATLAQVRSSFSTSPTSPVGPATYPSPKPNYSPTTSSRLAVDTDTRTHTPPLLSPGTPRVIVTPADSPSPPTPELSLSLKPASVKSEDADDWLMSQADVSPSASRKQPSVPRDSSPLVGVKAKGKSHSPRHVSFSPDAESPTASSSKLPLERDMDVDTELLSLVDDESTVADPLSLITSPSSKQPTVPLFSAPPMREASKKGGAAAAAKGFIPTFTQPKKKGAEPKDTSVVKTRGKSGPKPSGRGRGRGAAVAGRGRGRGTALLTDAGRKASAGKKNSLLVQAQENRARSLLHAMSKTDEVDPAEGTEDNDRLYCLCKSRYDEDRVMIGCDRCDEWYHPTCVQLQETDVEAIDLYVCPACRTQNPHLQMTRKTLCKRDSCGKSARKTSKYCSDECGVLCMKALVESKGLDKASLWEAVKDVRKPEGRTLSSLGPVMTQQQSWAHRQSLEMDKHNDRLTEIQRERKVVDKVMAGVDARAVLLDKAITKAALVNDHLIEVEDDSEGDEGRRGECGWDTRLMWSDEEWAAGVEAGTTLEGYGSVPLKDDSVNWWCPEGVSCSRHAGWQKLQKQDVEKEKEILLEALNMLTARERDIRIRMDALLNPDAVSSSNAATGGGDEDSQEVTSPLEDDRSGPVSHSTRGSGKRGRGRGGGSRKVNGISTSVNGVGGPSGSGASSSRGRKKVHV